ncbi:hypothetical protein C8R46DRAFT_1116061 [Mycena filopes]|nr:hypothetical protein C8R46DRAFT_1116061 [Mycena filopes]
MDPVAVRCTRNSALPSFLVIGVLSGNIWCVQSDFEVRASTDKTPRIGGIDQCGILRRIIDGHRREELRNGWMNSRPQFGNCGWARLGGGDV